MKFVHNNFFFLFTIVIIGSQLLFVCTENSPANIESNSLDMTKRYRFDKKDLTASIDTSETNDHDDNGAHAFFFNKRYRLDKRYRFDKRSDLDGINKRYRLDKRYRFD